MVGVNRSNLLSEVIQITIVGIGINMFTSTLYYISDWEDAYSVHEYYDVWPNSCSVMIIIGNYNPCPVTQWKRIQQ